MLFASKSLNLGLIVVFMVTLIRMTSGERNVTMEARLAISPKRPRLVKRTPEDNQISIKVEKGEKILAVLA